MLDKIIAEWVNFVLVTQGLGRIQMSSKVNPSGMVEQSPFVRYDARSSEGNAPFNRLQNAPFFNTMHHRHHHTHDI